MTRKQVAVVAACANTFEQGVYTAGVRAAYYSLVVLSQKYVLVDLDLGIVVLLCSTTTYVATSILLV